MRLGIGFSDWHFVGGQSIFPSRNGDTRAVEVTCMDVQEGDTPWDLDEPAQGDVTFRVS